MTMEEPELRRIGEIVLSLGAGRGEVVLPCDEVRWVEAAGDCACVHMMTRKCIVPYTLEALEPELCADQFVRVHAASIVRLACVRSFAAHTDGGGVVELDQGEQVRMGAGYRPLFEALWRAEGRRRTGRLP